RAAAAAHHHLRRHHLDDRRAADLRRAPVVRPVRSRRRRRAVADPDDLPVRAGLDPVQLRAGLGRGGPADAHHRRLRSPQLPAHPAHRRRRKEGPVSAVAPTSLTTTITRTRTGRTGRPRHTRPGWVVYGCLSAVVLGSMFPIWWSFLIASHDSTILAREPFPLVPGGNFLKNAATVIDTVPFWKATMNSLIVSTTVAASVVFFSTLAGYAFAKLRFRGSGPLLVFVIATMAVPVQLGVIPLFQVMAKLGWTGELVAVIVPGLCKAFGVFWMTQYLRQAIPDELIEAARVDGCSMIRTFWHVAVPAARPAAA